MISFLFCFVCQTEHKQMRHEPEKEKCNSKEDHQRKQKETEDEITKFQWEQLKHKKKPFAFSFQRF
jgi:hypothetical protein